jgi:bifunctional UDP-N-acetylglucosamine pyrophosphorylase/glucosamine-1-phosphate N-acetyltransferase
MNSIQAVVLAAGRSKRFNTGTSKLLEKICGKEMVLYPLDSLYELSIKGTLVVGYKKEEVIERIQQRYGSHFTFIEQVTQQGSGHAIMCSKDTWHSENIMIINGDSPLITASLLQKLIAKHIGTNAAMTFVTSYNIDPMIGSYGRVIETDGIMEIVEAADFKGDQSAMYPINAGIYLLKRSFLERFIQLIPQSPVTKEYYFTEIVRLGSQAGEIINTIEVPFDSIRGVNTLKELWIAEQIKRSELINHWMEKGVRFVAAQTVHLDVDVQLSQGCVIESCVQLKGTTIVGSNTTIESFSYLQNSIIGENCHIGAHSTLKSTSIGHETIITPYSYIHQNECEQRIKHSHTIELTQPTNPL